jgi:hypothetical protein
MALSVLELRHYPMKSINPLTDEDKFQDVPINIQCNIVFIVFPAVYNAWD